MRRPTLLCFACLLILPLSLTQAAPRSRVLIDTNWRFQLADPTDATKEFTYAEFADLAKMRKPDLAAIAHLIASRVDPVAAHLGEKISFVQPGFPDSAWREVDLPHDWAVELPFNPKADLKHGFKDLNPAAGTTVGWYRRALDLPDSDRGRIISIEFDGVYRNSLVWLNGHCLGRHPSGYTSFIYDLTPYVNFGGPNELVVRVDASRNEGWFYEGAGIYRHVWLLQTDPIHVPQWGTYITSTVAANQATVTVQTQIHNDSASAADCVVVSSILDPSGKEIANAASNPISVAAGLDFTASQQLPVPDPQLWSLEIPNLYTLVTTVQSAGQTRDVYQTPFGIRTIRFDPNEGFFLNGKRVQINGVCNHQDFAGVGTAVPDALEEYRVKLLKQMGCNGWRTSHNAPNPALLDACDKEGMLVMDENRRMGDDPDTLSQLQSLIIRDRNHPSVIIWSLGNEEPLQGEPSSVAILESMQNLAHKFDPTRPCTVAMNGSWGLGFTTIIDVQGFNYINRVRPRVTGLTAEKVHQMFPDKPCIGTEEASTTTTRGMYADDKIHGYVASYDLRGVEKAEAWWPVYATHPWLAGAFIWTGFDYRGEPTPYGWPCISSHFGVMDTCGFPKDLYYYYKAEWTTHPVLHLLPHWNWQGKEGQPIKVWCYTNDPSVELFLNGKSLGRKDVPAYSHVEWIVPYSPGTLEARAYHGSDLIQTDKVETTGDPARLVLTPSRTDLTSDGRDVVILNVAIVDAQDRTVPTANNHIEFNLTGAAKILGVGNGDPSCHEPDKATQRSAFNGLCMAIVQSGRQAGNIQVTASAAGLQPATVNLRSKIAGIQPSAP